MSRTNRSAKDPVFGRRCSCSKMQMFWELYRNVTGENMIQKHITRNLIYAWKYETGIENLFFLEC